MGEVTVARRGPVYSTGALRLFVRPLTGIRELEEITGRRRDQAYAAREIVRISQGTLGES